MNRTVIGIDVGATLAKLAVRGPDGNLECSFWPSTETEILADRVRALTPEGVGLTGCGAHRLKPHLSPTPQTIVEFEAWASGSRELLDRQGVNPDSPYVLVSVGTGTSMLLVVGDEVRRLGGTALGGGTLLGLGFALTGCQSHSEFCSLAEQGGRGEVDLLVQDIYPPDEIELPGEATAASFGGLARMASQMGKDSRYDQSAPLAAAVTQLVGENVALLTAALAEKTSAQRIVFGGSSLEGHPHLQGLLAGITTALGFEAILLDRGGYAGAIGALSHSAS
ncbi:MAG: hypothetical protein CBC48_01390 [bacterium TMED88]|nr:hypothetical protein [Deltaproteobacteria bacterium]OUV36900.1 MAG: hypothetical protein CBC48_01390 [bacterium TMED88]